MLVMLYLKPEQVQHWDLLASATPESRRDLEIDLFQCTHDEVGLTLASSWGLPADLALAMGYHHDGPPQDADVQDIRLCKVAACADWMATVYRCGNKRHHYNRCQHQLRYRL